MLVATALVLPAACVTHQSAERKPPVDPEWWLASLDVAMDSYFDAIEKVCPPQGFLSNEKCLKTKMVESFAKQNSAVTHCQTDDTLIRVLLCADLLTASDQIYRILGVDPQSAMDWDDPFGSLESVSQLLETRLTSKCIDTAQVDCVAQEIADTLGVSRNDADRCVLTSDVTRQVNCAAGLIRIENFGTALHDVK